MSNDPLNKEGAAREARRILRRGARWLTTVRLQKGVASRAKRWGFVLLNVWLVYHLAAIIIAPWSVPPSSRIVRNAWCAVGPYVQLFFLNHGYHYFAPEPGNSTLVAYVLEMPDGKQVTGRIPNPGIRPRLFYHRHFMLTESLGSEDVLAPGVKEKLVQAMAHELCREHQGAPRRPCRSVTHRLPSMERIRAGARLTIPKATRKNLWERSHATSRDRGPTAPAARVESRVRAVATVLVPIPPIRHRLRVMRILFGGMLLYTHAGLGAES